MLNLNQLDINLSYALQEHSKHICKSIKDKLDEILIPNSDKFSTNELIKEFLKSDSGNLGNEAIGTIEPIESSIKNIVEAKHDNLKKINKRFEDFINSKSTTLFNNLTSNQYLTTKKKEDKVNTGYIHEFFKRLETVFSYTTFGGSNYSKYKLTENLGVRTCVYCNRMYAITHYKSNGSNLMNPQLDHWLPKSFYPLLQISFHNLIPSCEICNTRVKRIREFKEGEHVHPYDISYEEITFTYRLNHNTNEYKIMFENDGKSINKVRDTFEYMYVDDMHNAHILELKDLIKIKKSYGDTYLKRLSDSFPDISISEQDRYRLAFGVELDPRKFHLYPLSKFKYDILKELEIIKI
jgi:glutaredoxin